MTPLTYLIMAGLYYILSFYLSFCEGEMRQVDHVDPDFLSHGNTRTGHSIHQNNVTGVELV